MRILNHFTWPQIQGGKRLVLLLTLLAAVIFLLSFIVGFFTSFPDTVLRTRLLTEVNRLLPAGNRFEAETVSLKFPLYLQLTKSRLIMDSPLLPELALTMVELSPTMATLVGRPGLNVSADSELGQLEGNISRSGAVALYLRDGRFNLPIPQLSQLQLAGTISSLDLIGQLRAEKNEPIEFNAVISDLLLVGAKQLGVSQNEISLGQLTLALSGTGRSLQIEQFSLSGGAVAITGTGRVVLQQPFNASRLDLNLQIRPEAAATGDLRTLLELLGPVGKDGSHSLQLRGRLLAPQIK